MKTLGVLLILSLTMTVEAEAALYRYVDEQGNVVYTDRPVPGAEPVSPGAITVIPTTPKTQVEIELAPPQSPPVSAKEDTGSVDYQLRIVRPRPDQGVRANDGRVPVEVRVEPKPKAASSLVYQAYLDGQPYGDPSRTLQWILEGVPRGTHTLTVAMLDEKGRELARSPAITFHVLRVSRLIRPR